MINMKKLFIIIIALLIVLLSVAVTALAYKDKQSSMMVGVYINKNGFDGFGSGYANGNKISISLDAPVNTIIIFSDVLVIKSLDGVMHNVFISVSSTLTNTSILNLFVSHGNYSYNSKNYVMISPISGNSSANIAVYGTVPSYISIEVSVVKEVISGTFTVTVVT